MHVMMVMAMALYSVFLCHRLLLLVHVHVVRVTGCKMDIYAFSTAYTYCMIMAIYRLTTSSCT